MAKLLTNKQARLIVNNLVEACNNTEKLSKAGYKFIYLANGFIAHYDIYGFKAYYIAEGDLCSDILEYKHQNQYKNISPGDENYEYYMQKKEIYNAVCKKLENRNPNTEAVIRKTA